MPFSEHPQDRDEVWQLENDFDAFFEFLTTPQDVEPACSPPATEAPAACLPAPAAARQGVGTLHNAAVAVSGNEMRKGRAKVHVSPAARTAAYRANRARVDYTDTPETVAKLHDIAQALDCSANELLRSMVRFALLNRNWRQVGLFGARKHGDLL